MQILSILVFDKTPRQELLTDFQVNQNVKELLGEGYTLDSSVKKVKSRMENIEATLSKLKKAVAETSFSIVS